VSETALSRAIREAVNLSGLAVVWRAQAGRVRVAGGWMRLAPPGMPDLVGYLSDGTGRFVAIEVKVPGHRTDRSRRGTQQAWRERIAQAGGVALEVESAAQAVREVGGAWRR